MRTLIVCFSKKVLVHHRIKKALTKEFELFPWHTHFWFYFLRDLCALVLLVVVGLALLAFSGGHLNQWPRGCWLYTRTVVLILFVFAKPVKTLSCDVFKLSDSFFVCFRHLIIILNCQKAVIRLGHHLLNTTQWEYNNSSSVAMYIVANI